MEAEKKRAAWRLLPGTTGGCLINTDRTDGKVRIQKEKKKKKEKKKVKRQYGPAHSVVRD